MDINILGYTAQIAQLQLLSLISKSNEVCIYCQKIIYDRMQKMHNADKNKRNYSHIWVELNSVAPKIPYMFYHINAFTVIHPYIKWRSCFNQCQPDLLKVVKQSDQN